MKNRLLIIILACLSMLGASSTNTYLPSFPSIAAEFQIAPVGGDGRLSLI